MTIDVVGLGGTQIWPIFRIGSAGENLTDEFKAAIQAEYFYNPESLDIDWESGSFSDDTGAKVDNVARLRTPNKIEVPADATGITFVPTGSFDLWIKTYETADQGMPTMNGIKNSTYWNTSYKGVSSLTWAQICTNNTRPNYVDFVLKTSASTLVPSDAGGVIINFTK